MDEDNIIPLYAFGDTRTRHHSVKLIEEVRGLPNAVKAYRRAAAELMLSGPTSFAPMIEQAIEIVKENRGQYHILVIIGDGAVSKECISISASAIVRASDFPLSIIMIGVGDGPWDDMKDFDDNLPTRKFDNFQFVPFSPFHEALMAEKGDQDKEAIEIAFALAALQEIPAQYEQIRQFGLLGDGGLKRKANIEAEAETSKRSRT